MDCGFWYRQLFFQHRFGLDCVLISMKPFQLGVLSSVRTYPHKNKVSSIFAFSTDSSLETFIASKSVTLILASPFSHGIV